MRAQEFFGLVGLGETFSRSSVVPGVGKTEEQIVDDFSASYCYALALAHDRRYGWPIYLVATTEDDPHEFYSFHAFVMHPTDVGLDVNGPQKPSTLLVEYGGPEEDGWRLNRVTEKELLVHLSAPVRRFELAALPYAYRVIDFYLKVRFPSLYAP